MKPYFQKSRFYVTKCYLAFLRPKIKFKMCAIVRNKTIQSRLRYITLRQCHFNDILIIYSLEKWYF